MRGETQTRDRAAHWLLVHWGIIWLDTWQKTLSIKRRDYRSECFMKLEQTFKASDLTWTQHKIWSLTGDLTTSPRRLQPVCIFSTEWRCSQVGRAELARTHSHTPTHLHAVSVRSVAFNLPLHVLPTHHRPLSLFLSASDPRLWFISAALWHSGSSLCIAHSHAPPMGS